MINFKQFITEASVIMDATDPESRVLKKLLKKHKVKMEIVNNEGPSGFPEVELTGARKDLEAVLASEDGWDDAGLNDYIEESNSANESKIVIKRKYTESYPAVTVGKSAKIRNKMLEAISDGKITQEEFNSILKEMSTDSPRWMRRNNKFFSISEEGISLSKFGKKALSQITVNEEELDEGRAFVAAAKKAKDEGKKEFEFGGKKFPVQIKEEKKSQFIYESFRDFVNFLTESKEATEAESILADLLDERGGDMGELHGMEIDDALDTVESYGHKGAKAKKIAQELVSMTNESLINEAFASVKLASILTGGNKMPKDLPKAFYNMSKIALDKVQDVDIIEIDPQAARKEKRQNAVYLYFTTNEKENPYAARGSYGVSTIPANTLLAITDGSNEWMNMQWQNKYNSKDRKKSLQKTKRDDSSGFDKSSSNDSYGSGISSLTKVAELADRAYCLDLDILKARYSTTAKRDERADSKAGAIAFKSDKDFKKANLDRYNTIISDRASKMPLDKMVADAIDTITKQIKDGLVKGEKGKYGDIIIGRNKKGSEAKLSEAARHMQYILDDFQRYVSSSNQAKIEKDSGYSGNYYDQEIKRYAKDVSDKLKQVEDFGYIW